MGDFVAMPKLGMTMKEGTITKWLVCEGDAVEKGDYIFETETDKTALEVDSLLSGKLLKIYHFEGETVKVNDPVAYIGEEGERAPELTVALADAVDAVDAVGAAPVEPSPAPAVATAPASHTLGSAAPTPVLQAASGEARPGFDKAKRPYGEFLYDLIVIGSGPGGYVAAIRAAQLGAKVAVAEKGEIGGTCLNRGCIPTKALYASARRYRDVKAAESMGVSVDKVSFSWKKIQSRKDAVVEQLRSGVEGLLKKNGIDVLRGEARIVKAHEVKVGRKSYSAAFALIATGATPSSVVKAGAEVMNTDEALSLAKLPKSIAILGGGVIGCEFAGIFSAFGVKTTIIELMPRILPPVDAEVADALASKMEGEGIALKLGVTADDIKKSKRGYDVSLSSGETVTADLVVEAVGRRPETRAFESLGAATDGKGYLVTDAFMRTDIDGVYAIGDITGKHQLAHAASAQGILAVEHMFKGVQGSSIDIMPSCIFGAYEIAAVGLTEEQAKASGVPYSVYKFPYSANGKALTMGETGGFAKVIKDERWGEILGVHIIGADASSLIEEAVMAMSLEATASVAGGTIHPHPTLSEILMEAFLGADGGAIHL
ncbi:MAG: dihydrolipoyl dehydrogenase [Clostridiales Family XIII bacterium]|jgi:dihydrolipoamide dehydrogenase|nr:dihydrolipoyl dehydrogenase [Clostridiales Family XIII bacterium]